MRIGIDLGATKIIAGIVDNNGRVIKAYKIPTERSDGYERVIDRVITLIHTIVRKGKLHWNDIERIGIAAAGQIDKDSKTVIFSPNLRWHNVPIKQDIERAFKIEVVLENDVNAATYGEWKFGLQERFSNVIGVFVGTGIGGGLMINGKLYRGYQHVGGEIGHMIVNPHGYPCHCGTSGCFEAYCGGSYIIERVQKFIQKGYRGKLWDIIQGKVDELHVGHIEEAYCLGDSLCKNIWEEVIEYMGTGLASLVNLLNPEVIVMGGGVIQGTKFLITDACNVMERRAMKASIKDVRIEKAQFGDTAAIMGVAFISD